MIKKILHKLLACCLFVGSAASLHAQVDPHFSQYYAYPLALNPGLTGAVDAQYRVAALYHNQWQQVSNAYSTMGISADVTTNSNVSLGANIFRQAAGSGGYQFVNGYLTMAWNGIQLDAGGYKRLGLGIQGGVISRQFDPSRLQFGNQWVAGVGYQPAASTGEVFDHTSAAAFDAGAGIAYYDGAPDQDVNVFGGFSAMHLTRPEDPFLKGAKETLPVKYTLHAGSLIRLNDALAVVPNAIYMRQGTAQEEMLGAYAQLSIDENTDLLLGGNWRIKDAVVPFAGLTFSSLTLGLSYDVTISQLGRMVKGTSSFELSLTYTGKQRSKTDMRQYMCPRL